MMFCLSVFVLFVFHIPFSAPHLFSLIYIVHAVHLNVTYHMRWFICAGTHWNAVPVIIFLYRHNAGGIVL